MTDGRHFSVVDRVNSFRYAIRGIVLMLRSQHNAWLHAVATCGVVAGGIMFDLSGREWCWLILAMVAVWSAEALNTALEFLADVASSEFHPMVEKAKDVAAGGVLISAIGATVVAGFIFGPRLYSLIISLV